MTDRKDLQFLNDPQFLLGSISALEAFRDELLNQRGRIENETEPAFDVIVDLLNLSISAMREPV